ncbi:hypothetical protein RE6C_05844 [Rhodopirellula europaea 6C]|uniref:Uncharacterized protein n=1 Tax=Rhodopirellula europaea 6C TaxID=1263867 RepID=M2A3A7_9BACT|nr:hypothetical protein RE6C_05844 [Rhodopirellula europaea 6C]
MGFESRESRVAISGWFQFNRTVRHRFHACGCAEFIGEEWGTPRRVSELSLAS